MTISFLSGNPAFLDGRFPLPLDRPFTTRQARAEGVSDHVLGRLVREGLLLRILKGVYVATPVDLTRELRGQALCLAAPPGSVVTDWTATWYWTGVDHPRAHLAEVPLSVFRFRGHGRLRNSLVASGERWFRPSDVVPLDGNVSVSLPIRTAWDLGRFYPGIVAIGGMDALARHGTFAVEELVAGVERFAKQRGVVRLRRLAPLIDPRAESTGESALRFRWYETPGMPRPELQIAILDDDGRELFRIDLGVEGLRLGAEYDGEQWHTAPEDRDHDECRRDTLDVVHGWHIEVFRRENVFGQREDVTARLPDALRAARRRTRGA
jgi:hypothetical protein